MRKDNSLFNQPIGLQRFHWRRNTLLAAVILVMAWPAPRSVGADAGDLDSTFGMGGKITMDFSAFTSHSEDIVIQQDGKIVTAGSVNVSGTSTGDDFALVRLNSDGSLDTTFGNGGTVFFDFFGTSDHATAVSLQSDGKIVAAGSSHTSPSGGNSAFTLARFNSDGSPDTTFGNAGKVITEFLTGDDRINEIAIQADGKIVVGGFSTGLSSRDLVLARYQADGSLDTTFGNGGTIITDFYNGSDEVHSLALQSDGKIVVAGRAGVEDTDSLATFAVLRYSPDGSLDATFGSGGTVVTDFPGNEDVAYAVIIQDDGKIVAAGSVFDTVSSQVDFVVTRYSPDGGFDPTFGADGIVVTDFFGDWDLAFALALQTDGKIVAAGSAATDGLDDFALARYNTDGSLDATFSIDGKTTTDFSTNENVSTTITNLAFQTDGRIVATGFSDRAGFALARYLGDTFANTPVGSNVIVQPVDSTTGGMSALLIFSQVTQAGVTSLTTNSTGPAPPSGFHLGDPPTYYDLATTAVYTGQITVCINYSGVSFQDETQLKLFHFEGGAWEDRTTSLDITNDIICADVSSLSPFAIFEPGATACPQLTALDRANVWIGLKNSDAIGIKFDLLAEVYKNGVLVGSGRLDSVPGGSSGFTNASLNTIPMTLIAPVAACPGDTLSFRLYARNACLGSGKNSGTARLWYNDPAANSRFETTIGNMTSNYSLLDGFALSAVQGLGPKMKIDIAAGAKCSPFKLFGTWNITR